MFWKEPEPTDQLTMARCPVCKIERAVCCWKILHVIGGERLLACPNCGAVVFERCFIADQLRGDRRRRRTRSYRYATAWLFAGLTFTAWLAYLVLSN